MRHPVPVAIHHIRRMAHQPADRIQVRVVLHIRILHVMHATMDAHIKIVQMATDISKQHVCTRMYAAEPETMT